jgi:DNA-binding CsgD family transcriptional regulator
MTASTSMFATLPLVGRSSELALLGGALDAAEAARGGALFLAGEGGVGKTRLVKAAADQAGRRGWNVAFGRAYPVETGVPYAPFSDALLPLLRRLDSAALSLLTRGGSAELAHLFPSLAPPGDRSAGLARGEPAELKSRLLWNFTQFLVRFAQKQPLLIVLENLQWADASSLELLHFVVRQIGAERILLLCTYNEAERDTNPTLRTTEQSLATLGAARVHHVAPLSLAGTGELVKRLFGADESVTREFVALLYGWTRGNAFFIEETLKALVDSGRLYERDGTWLGWELEGFDLPRSIRDAILARLDRLTPAARTTANFAAVLGTRASFETLGAVTGLGSAELLTALDELRRQRVLSESAEGDAVVYDFTHPILQQTLYAELGLARARMLHAAVAEALEQRYGARAFEHADELAFHFARADARSLAGKAATYLAAAGRDALAKHANREAADYLGAALELASGEGGAPELAPRLIEDLARARQRLGDYDGARALWERARTLAAREERFTDLAAIERRMGLACYWSGHHAEALQHYEAGIAAARRAGDDTLLARLVLAKGMCHQELGGHEPARRDVQEALTLAERLGDKALLARVHRGMLLIHMWTGNTDQALEHGAMAIALADESNQLSVSCTAHWALAMVNGLTGNAREIAHHLAESERLADVLRSPLLRIWTAELAIEYAAGLGDWDVGITIAERAISMARSFGQRTLLPRVLVWAALIYLQRGDVERGKRYVDEAWELSGAGRGAERPIDVHTVVPAHIGLAAYYLTIEDYPAAIHVGEKGLAIADRSGYVVWALHRLLPIIAEASLWAQDLQRAERIGKRLRVDSTRMGNKLGLAWADACEALISMVRGEGPAAFAQLRRAAEELEAIPYVPDAARLRRQLARVLAESGEREEAMKELRHVHDVFARLGAVRELNLARDLLRQLGGRPPARTATAGVAGLTGREVEIVRLVAERKSNKEIAKALGISPRTVSTHLSNIFGKLSVGSRGELADFARQTELSA